MAVTVDPMQDRHLAVKGGERLGLLFKFRKARLQYYLVIIIAAHERSVAIRTDRSFREFCAFTAGGEAAFGALETAGNAVVHGLFRNFEQNRQVERCPTPAQNRHQTLRLGQRPWKTVKNESVTAVQTQPIFNQFNDDFI